ncbi:MAG TPA: LysR family transcriptional regulator [Pyrinomonadaceae bacterium]|nr:LysR family transcriptional regulator [Pyrinomonadaceae bacterium]
MELMQLEMFVAVVEEGSVQRAAEKVSRTQPAISIALKKLEAEVGSRLFDRSQRYDYQLTAAGELLYSYATRLVGLREEAVLALRELSHLRRGAVRIGVNESTSVYLLPRLTQAFHEQYPDLKIEVTCGHSEFLLGGLYERRLDLALLAHLPEEHDLETRRIMSDELVLIVSPRHRLAQVEQIHVRELAAESIITEGAASSLHERVVQAFRQHQTPLNIHVESATIETIKKMVAKGVGVAFVPLMCVEEEIAGRQLVVVPVEGLQYERSLWAVRRRSDAHSHAALAFMRVVNALAEKLELDHAAEGEVDRPAAVVNIKARKNG